MSTTNYYAVEATARLALERWRNKPHNAKWWKKIEGTPIPNDLIVCISEDIAKALATPSSTAVGHGSSCEFIKGGKGTCGPDCAQPSGVSVLQEHQDLALSLVKPYVCGSELGECVAGIAQALANAAGQPSEVGEPRTFGEWRTKMERIAKRERGSFKSLDAWEAYLVGIEEGTAREVGEGLREIDKALDELGMRFLNYGDREGWSICDDGHKLRALAAPAPKPAPPSPGEDAWLDEIMLVPNSRDKLRTILRAYRANLLTKPAPPAEPEAQVCKEILRIMDTYHEQKKSSHGVDTPGGLEHMGDVWSLFAKWELVLRRAAERKPQ